MSDATPTQADIKNSSLWPLIAVISIALAAMVRACGNDWAYYDDDLFLFRNPRFSPPTFATLAQGWSEGFRGLWTPITYSAWWIIAKFAALDVAEPNGIRLNPWLFHAFNVLVHCVSSVLVFALVRRIVRSPLAALAGTIVFAAHPIQVEAVAWTCGTKDLLAMMFMLASLLMMRTSRLRWSSAAIAIAFAACAMLSKPSAAILPAMVVIYFWIERSSESLITVAEPPRNRLRWITVFAMAAMAIPIVVIARQVQDVADVPFVSILARPVVELDAIAMQLSHLAWPAKLCADYGLTPAELLASPRRWWTWLLPAAIALSVWRSRNRVLIGGALLCLVALLPNLGLAPFQFQVYSTVADRYAYPAMFGIAIVVAWLFLLIERFRKGKLVLAAMLAVVLVVRSAHQCATWSGPSALWTQTLAVNPSSSLAHNNLGATLAATGDVRGAIAHFEAAANNNGASDTFALLNLAQLHLRLGDANAAADDVVRLIDAYHRRAEFDPQLARKTLDHFDREIRQIDPSASDQLRAQTKTSLPIK